jgi:trimethylamine--corrinoid protein Co-methyltransferase
VIVENTAALQLLDNAGALVDHKTMTAKIPPHLVEEAIRLAPRTTLFAGRNAKYDMRLERGRVHFGTGEGATTILDHETGIVRLSTKEDIANMARLADALPNYDFVMPIYTAQDVPHEVFPLHALHAMLKNTEKPVMVVDFGLDATDLIRMASIVVGGDEALRERPILGMYCEPISPLIHGKHQTANLMAFAKAKLPIAYITAPASGSTAPATIAGSIVQSNAETLSGNVIAQLTSKGAKYIHGSCTSIFDGATGVFPYGAPEWMIINIAMAQLGRHYSLPTFSTGGSSDSKVLDGQATYEAALTLLFAAQSGANLVHDTGAFLNLGLTGSHDLLTICDEIVSTIKYVLDGIEISEETLALDVIHKVGPRGHYLSQNHTLKFFKQEHWFPSLTDRQVKQTWVKNGSKDVLQRANERTKEILRTHKPTPLPEGVERELDRVLSEAEKRILSSSS